MALDAYTKSLLHFDGANDSQVFTDMSGKVWTAAADAKLKTATKKFGASSAYFDGTGDHISTPDHVDFTVGSGDYTVDFWFNAVGTTGSAIFYGQSDAAGNSSSQSIIGRFLATNQLSAEFSNGSASLVAYSPTVTVTDGVWHHYAAIRYGNNLYCAIDGTLGVALSVTGQSVNDSSTIFCIGTMGLKTTNDYTGYIDEFRFSKGIARWTTNFTPPSRPYGFTPQIIIY